MAAAKEIVDRIQSIKNTQKTTKAMELVAGAKMRKAVNAALDTRHYHSIAWTIADRLREKVEIEYHSQIKRFFEDASVSEESSRSQIHTTILMITSNRGLCGAFNANVIKKIVQYVGEHGKEHVSIIGIGKKGIAMLSALGIHVEQAYEKADSAQTDESIIDIAAQLYKKFAAGQTDSVMVAFTDYQTALVQDATMHQLYPIPRKSHMKERISNNDVAPTEAEPELSETAAHTMYTYEPTDVRVLSYLVPRIAEVEIYQALLESNASEHSSRMVAMKSATEAAGEMGAELKLVYNRARQASITNEIAEISAGTAAVS